MSDGEERREISTHGKVIEFGKHKGQLWTRVPVSYLRWIVNNGGFLGRPELDLAQAEIERRGSTLPTVEISHHAIDRASLRVRKIWHEDREEDEGLYTWLCRVVTEAVELGQDGEKIRHKGMKLVIEEGEQYPVLKTILPDN